MKSELAAMTASAEAPSILGRGLRLFPVDLPEVPVIQSAHAA